MHIRCPHCHNPVDIVDGASLSDIPCPSCGSSFSLLSGESTRTLQADGPKTIGHFELATCLGIGTFGAVWKARDTELDRTVAVKIPRKDKLSPAETEQFLREARAAAQLRHPGIVSVHEVGREDDTVYIVSDFVDGVTLADWLTAQKPTAREAAELCIQIAEALHHAHEAGVIHRDLKPSNILLRVEGGGLRVEGTEPAGANRSALNPQPSTLNPIITDFGLARREAGEITMTVDGHVLGTPAYMSPEQARGEAHTADRRSDVYSLGVILFELLTGERPFRGNSRMLIHQVLHDDPPSPRALNAAVPRDLETICLKCLEKDPSRRYAAARGLAEDLQRYLKHEPITARPIGRIERIWRWTRRHPARAGLVAAIGVALLSVVGAGVAMAYQGELESANSDLGTANSNLASALDNAESSKRQAEQARDGERAQRQVAEAAEKVAVTQRRAAEAARIVAVTQRQAAVTARAKAERLQDELDQALYIRRVNLALAEWKVNEIERAAEFLVECPRKHRNWEWHYAYRVCHPELLTLLGHASIVVSLAYSPNGKRIASASADRTVIVWDAATGREILTLQGHSTGVHSVAFSPDGKRIASASSDKTVKLWDAVTGREILTLKGHTDYVNGVAFSPDGRRIASASSDKTVKLWDAATGDEMLTLRGHTHYVFGVAFSPDGKQIASGSFDKSVKVWDTMTGRETLTLKGHTQYVHSVAFRPDGNRIASASSDKTVKLWDTATGREILTLKGHTDYVYGVAFSLDGNRIASASFDKTVKLWNGGTGDEILTLKGHTHKVFSVAFSPDGKQIASASSDGSAKIWDALTHLESVTIKGLVGCGKSVAFSPDGKRIASCSDKAVKLCDSATGRATLTLKGHQGAIMTATFSPDGKRIASCGGRTVMLWDAVTGQKILTLRGHAGFVLSVAFSPDGKRIASASSDKTVKLWDTATGLKKITFKGHTDYVRSVAFSPDGKRIASASSDKTVKLWDTATGDEMLTLRRHTDYVHSVAFSPDGKRIASASGDKTVMMWNAATGDEMLTLKGHTGYVFRVSFSSDGKRIASGSSDKSVKLWDATTGDEMLTLRGHTHYVFGVAFSPDGKQLASASFDKTVKMWNARSGQWPDDPDLRPPVIARRPNAKPSHDRSPLQRAKQSAILRQWSSAAAAYRELLVAQPQQSLWYYYLADCYLASKNLVEYRGVCRQMLKRFGATSNSAVAGTILYTCLPGFVPETPAMKATYARLGELAAKGSTFNGRLYAAALFRVGRHQDALTQFEKSRAKFAPRAWDLLFLAMIHHHVGDASKARQHLSLARQFIARNRMGWTEQAEVQTLLKEATALIERNVKQPSPK